MRSGAISTGFSARSNETVRDVVAWYRDQGVLSQSL
jgi:hypothetical protein